MRIGAILDHDGQIAKQSETHPRFFGKTLPWDGLRRTLA